MRYYLGTAVLLSSLPTPVFAKPWEGCVEQGAATIGCLEPLFINVVGSIISLAVVALFIMIIVAGYKFIFAGGDAKQLEQAKTTLSGAILGIVVIVCAFLILRLIGAVTGVTDITKFEVHTEL